MKKKNSTLIKLIIIMVSLVIISLLVTLSLMRGFIKDREEARIREKIQATAKLIATNSEIIEAVNKQENNQFIQEYTMMAMEFTSTDFIVVMDTTFTRYSHPNTSLIGGKFSNLEDVGSTLTEGDHYSDLQGTMGAGLRYFTAIKNSEGNAIGVVCVGYTKKTVENQILKAQEKLLISLVIGLGVAIMLAVMFNKQLKKILLNYEPEEIAQSYIEKELISDHVSEGIIGIDKHHKIIVKNKSANELLKNVGLPKLKKDKQLSEAVYDLFFMDILDNKKSARDEQIMINNVDILVNRNPIYYKGELYGAVVTLRDQSELKKLITELSGTEKYNDSLREQNHNFMNKLHVLNGLIELKSYDEAEKYIEYLKDDYYEKLGHITENIKVPAIAGFLLAKEREASKKGVVVKVDSESEIGQKDGLDKLYNEVLVILGVLIDNSLEAIKTDSGRIDIYLYLNLDEEILICCVEDNGVGIKKDIQEEIFKRGYSTKGNNRGYGLDTVDTIVKKYEGLIEVESTEGKGTKLTVEIPIKEV